MDLKNFKEEFLQILEKNNILKTGEEVWYLRETGRFGHKGQFIKNKRIERGEIEWVSIYCEIGKENYVDFSSVIYINGSDGRKDITPYKNVFKTREEAREALRKLEGD